MNITRHFLCRLRNRDGSILILTFWALSFLSFFAVTIGFMARQKMVLAERLEQRVRLRMVAEAGVQRGVALLKRLDADLNVDSLKESWVCPQDFKDIKMGKTLLNVTITDEERKININTASLSVLKDFFKFALNYADSDAESLGSAIIDWRDDDSSPLAQGAEDEYYEGLQYPYECKDAKFDFLYEMLLVRGITATIYKDVRDYLTVNGSGIININTAPGLVILALGLDEKLVDKIMDFRSGEDAIEGTEDDRYFTDVAGMVSVMSQAVKLEQDESVALSNFASSGLIGVVSNNFLISSVAGYDFKRASAGIDCIFERILLDTEDGYKGKIKYWHITHG